MTGKEKNNLCAALAAFCPTAVREELPISHESVSGIRGSNFSFEPWGIVAHPTSDVSPGLPPPAPTPRPAPQSQAVAASQSL